MEGYKIITLKVPNTRSAHFLIAERKRSIYDSFGFDIGRFRAEPTNLRCLHPSDTFRIAVPTIICSLRYA